MYLCLPNLSLKLAKNYPIDLKKDLLLKNGILSMMGKGGERGCLLPPPKNQTEREKDQDGRRGIARETEGRGKKGEGKDSLIQASKNSLMIEDHSNANRIKERMVKRCRGDSNKERETRSLELKGTSIPDRFHLKHRVVGDQKGSLFPVEEEGEVDRGERGASLLETLGKP